MSNTSIIDDNERTRLIPSLEKTAERYFNKDESLAIHCGICFVIKEYDLMNSLMKDIGEPEYRFDAYHDTWEEWEPRAWMCLFLVAYLKDELSEEETQGNPVLLVKGSEAYLELIEAAERCFNVPFEDKRFSSFSVIQGDWYSLFNFCYDMRNMEETLATGENHVWFLLLCAEAAKGWKND